MFFVSMLTSPSDLESQVVKTIEALVLKSTVNRKWLLPELV